MKMRVSSLSVVTILLLAAGIAQAQVTVYDGPAVGWNVDTWNADTNNWSAGIPVGTVDVVIAANETPSCYSASTPVYTGSLIISNNATMHMVNQSTPADFNSLGTNIILHTGARLVLVSGSYTVQQPIALMGPAQIKLSEST